jgi:hypothetical protein
MGTPTVIRHAQTEGMAAHVITVFNVRRQAFDAYFQTYSVGLRQDRTSLEHSEVWSEEQGAIKKFEEWRAAEIGDMPGNL